MRQIDSILQFAHGLAGARLGPGAWAVDATAGNGHDTRALAEAVGAGGRVWAFDVQRAAIEATRRRLADGGLAGRVTLLLQDHASMRSALPPGAEGSVQAVMFNLGYLPGGDKTRTTREATTLSALRAAVALLAAGGVLTVVCYPGHDGGGEETRAVWAWAESLPQQHFRVLGYRFLNQRNDPPRLVAVEKIAADSGQ